MEKVICECCGCMFDKEKAVEKFDKEYGPGSYMHLYQWNDFCAECAEDYYQEDHTGNADE